MKLNFLIVANQPVFGFLEITKTGHSYYPVFWYLKISTTKENFLRVQILDCSRKFVGRPKIDQKFKNFA